MNLTLFGVTIGGLFVALVKVVQDWTKMGDGYANLLRAVLLAGAYVLIQIAPELQAAWPLFEKAVVIGGGTLAVFLGALGYWPDVQRIGYRVTGRSLPFRLQ